MSETNELIIPDMETVVQACLDSDGFKAEKEYARRGGYEVELKPRLYKVLYNDMIRVVFPTTVNQLEDGSVISITCLYDIKEKYNIYGHAICSGPGVNGLLRAIHSPLGSSLPQEGVEGEKQVLRFVAWKEAAWSKFLLDDLEMGNLKASEIWLANFWKALDRMFGDGCLVNYSL